MSSYDLEMLASNDAATAIVALSGELDLTNANDVGERLDAFADSPALVLDLNRVVFLDSAALHALFRLARERSPRRLALVLDPASPISRTLEIVRFADVAPVCSSLEEALSELD